jgi:glycosyltransferase involved in cell wall biosynthesis
VVTYADSARLLLAGQLRALSEISWALVSGEDYADAPGHLAVHVVPMRREPALSDLRSLAALYRFFRRHPFRFVQTHTPKASMLGLPAARWAGLPTLYTVHGAMFFKDNTRAQNVLGWLFERWCCTWARRVLVQSREDAATLPRARICRAGKVVFIGNGIDLERFRAVPPPSGTAGVPVVTMVSRLVAEKGCREFFEVARSLHGLARFVHVGPVEPDQSDAIPAEEVRALAEAGIVEFAGRTDDIPRFLAEADLVLLPSFREGIPRAAMEAAASGRAVAGYDVRGVREVIPPELGLLVPRGDTPALIELVRGLLADRERLVSLGRDCQAWVLANFSEADVIDRLRRVYEEVAPSAQRPVGDVGAGRLREASDHDGARGA